MKEPVLETLVDIANFLNQKSISFAVIGGLAVSLRGEPRVTGDVDIVIGIEVDQALALVKELSQSPFRPLFSGVTELVQTSFILPLLHQEAKVRVDLAIGLTGFERQLIARATNIKLGDYSIPVATAEDLILMKLFAGRPRDIDDASRIVVVQGEALDWEYLLKTGAELEEAAHQDIVTQLRKLRKNGM